ncbi:hypothetical protein ACHMW6_15435 [Pseudoduganella sp. UC29_106]|uniref:hypothetical protein n=1 Tax=Pseudoduganella sp. UC29_106 TaxID=3374553 RepID=UPI0037568FCC
MSKHYPPPPDHPVSVLGALEARLLKLFRKLNENQKRLYLSVLESVGSSIPRHPVAIRMARGGVQ